MEAVRERPELLAKSDDRSSLSDLNRCFFTDQSLSFSTNSFQRSGRSVVLDSSEPQPQNNSTSLLSPLVVLNNKQFLSPGNTMSGAGLSKSSTPYNGIKFQEVSMMSSCLNQSCVDLTATHPSWEVSFIKPTLESPKSCLEMTWSPIDRSASLTWPQASD